MGYRMGYTVLAGSCDPAHSPFDSPESRWCPQESKPRVKKGECQFVIKVEPKGLDLFYWSRANCFAYLPGPNGLGCFDFDIWICPIFSSIYSPCDPLITYLLAPQSAVHISFHLYVKVTIFLLNRAKPDFFWRTNNIVSLCLWFYKQCYLFTLLGGCIHRFLFTYVSLLVRSKYIFFFIESGLWPAILTRAMCLGFSLSYLADRSGNVIRNHLH